MSVSITLRCGCRINEAYVLGMCFRHTDELFRKQQEREVAYREFVRQLSRFKQSAGVHTNANNNYG